MTARIRISSRVAAALVLCFIALVWPGRPAAVQGPEGMVAADLDRALRATDLARARELVPVSWAASEQLFVSYLERAFGTPGEGRDAEEARALAGRLADVFFVIIEFDFARSVVLELDAADAAKRRQLVAVVRDYFSTLERIRTAPASATQSGFDPVPALASEQRYIVGRQMAAVAERFRALSFPRGQFWALASMLNVTPPADGPRLSAARVAVEKELGDDVTRVARRPYTEASLALAERLDFPKRQATILEELPQKAAQSSDPAQLEAAARCLERALTLKRSVSALEDVNYWTFSRQAPTVSTFTLPNLWSVYLRLGRTADAEPLLAEALEISRPFGEAAQKATLRAFGAAAGRSGEAAVGSVVGASRALGPVFELSLTRDLALGGGGFRPDVAERALALALALPDARERAVTLEWYARSRETARRRMLLNPGRYGPASLFDTLANDPFPAAFDHLLEASLDPGETDLVAVALGHQATAQSYAGDAARSAVTFTRALDLAASASNPGTAAEIALRAVQSKLAAFARAEFASRAVEAAGKAGAPLVLARALRARASMAAGGSGQRLEDLQQALAAADKSGDVVEQVLCLQALAHELALHGEPRQALEALQRAAALGSLDRPDATVPVYQQMASIYTGYLNEPALAQEAVERARQTVKPWTAPSPSGAPSIYVADAHFTLATLERDLGRPTAALEEYARALEKPDATANWRLYHRRFLTSRARYLAQLGDYEAALADWSAVAALMKATEREYPGSPAFQRAAWLTEVARVHVLAGNDAEAAKAAREAVAVLTRDASDVWTADPLATFGFRPTSDMPDPLDTFQTLAAVLLRIKAPDDLVALCDSYHKGVLAGPLPQPVSEKAYHETLAGAYLLARRADQARERLLAAVAIDRAHPTAQVGGLAGSLLALGRLESTAGNAAKAKQYLLEARAAANPYDANQIWQIERWLGAASLALRDTAAASAHYGRSLAALESARERLRPEEFRLRYGEDPERIYEEYAGLLAAAALSSGRPADAERAFDAAERKRSHLLNRLVTAGWSRLPAEAVPDQLRRLFELEASNSAKLSLLREQFLLPEGQRSDALVETLLSDRKRIEADHAQLLASLGQSRYRYATPATDVAPLALPVRAALGPSRVLVEYLVTEERSYAFVVSARAVNLVRLPIGRAALRTQVQHLLGPFRQARAGEVDLTRLRFDTAAAHALYQAIFGPLRPHLGSATSIVIVRDDVLHFLPFDVLLERAPVAAPRGRVLHARFAAESFLIRRYGFSYLTSSAQLLSTSAAGAAPQAPKRLFAIANPTTGWLTPPSQDDPVKRQLRSGAFDLFLSPLPGAEAEVRQIARHFAQDASTVVLGAEATEAAYHEKAGGADVVHFATHALASDGQPLYSTLVMAPDAAAGQDGFLQAYEVLRTPLRAELVVLSACETALGSEDRGQGLVGLAAAFEQAGARSVLATLWSVDESTAEVMAAFYRATTQGSSTSAALRRAKLQLMQQRVRIGKVEVSLAHPFFWAPFILVGAPANPPAGQ